MDEENLEGNDLMKMQFCAFKKTYRVGLGKNEKWIIRRKIEKFSLEPRRFMNLCM